MNKLSKDLSMQDYVTLGYLYLVLLGAVNIVIYYSDFNINIFDYIAISDILLAPINMLFLDYKTTAVIIIVVWIVSYLLKLVFFGINKLVERIANKFNKPIRRVIYQPVIAFIILFSYIFLTLTIDMTNSVSSGVKNMTYKLNTKLTFADNTQKTFVLLPQRVCIYFT